MQTKNLDILQQFTLLYLEDDEDLLRHTTDILEDFVHHIYPVKTSTQAMEILNTHKIDVIISDILLKDENGIDFLQYIQNEKNIYIPTILTTAHTDTQYLLDAIKLKVENYIIKPVKVKELLETLHDVLLPIIQRKEIKKNENIIKTISHITDSKQVEIIKLILNNLDNEDIYQGSYSDIMNQVTVSKPTLIKLFKELSEKDILVKTHHKTYQFNEKALNNI